MMKIVIDARLYNESGIGRYLRNLIYHLSLIDQENEYYLLLLKKDLSITLPDNFKKIEVNAKWYSYKEQLVVPKVLYSLRADLVHFPHFNVPILYRGKFIVTIHDLLHQHFAMKKATTLNPFHYKIKSIAYNKSFSSAIKKSRKIITPTQFVKKQLMNEWNIDSSKIAVTHEAAEDSLHLIKEELKVKEVQSVKKKFEIHSKYIYYVGNAHPHKNLETLVSSFLLVKADYPHLQLVLSGPESFFWKRLKKDFKDPSIIYTGAVTEEELVQLYSGAHFFVIPSFEEGFGLPVLEAMACECPVLASSAGALKEVGADAALYFDPSNKEDLVAKMKDLIQKEDLREKLIEKGKKRQQLFSWSNLAKETLTIYEKT